jgi:hypothetical protein
VAEPTYQYRAYKSDEDKAKAYNRKLAIADQRFGEWKDEAEDWYTRYENAPRRSQYTPKGHRVNTPTGVATIDALFSAMTAIEVDPHTTVLGGGTREQAELATAALKKEWRLCRVNEEVQDAVKDGLVVGIGFVKVGYEYHAVQETVPRPAEDIRAEVIQMLREATSAAAEGQANVPSPDEIAGLVPIEQDVERVIRDRIVVDYCSYQDIRWDPAAKRWEDVTWVAQITKVPATEVRENPIYRDYVKRNRKAGGLRLLDELRGETTYDEGVLPGGKPEQDELFVDVVELWDLRAGTICTFVRGRDWLLNEGVNPFALNYDFKDRNPFVGLVLRQTNTRVRGISDMELMAPSLDEQNVYRSKTATYIERFVPKVMGPEDALTDEGKEALSSPEYGAYISIAREYQGESITPLDPPQLPTEAFQMEQRIEDSIREATGVNELMRGLFPDRKRTATETSEVVSASAARQAEKRNVLERFFTDIARRMLQLMQQFYEQPRMVRYVDDLYGQVEWSFGADDIAMEYDIDIALTPKEAVTTQSQRDDALALFNMLVPLAEPGPDGSSTVDKAALARYLATAFGISKQDQLDLLTLPEEQQAQQLAAQQAAAGMASAAAGQPQPGMTTGPLGDQQVAALTNQGAVPPEVAAAAQGIGPLAPEAVEQVSESAGIGGNFG